GLRRRRSQRGTGRESDDDRGGDPGRRVAVRCGRPGAGGGRTGRGEQARGGRAVLGLPAQGGRGGGQDRRGGRSRRGVAAPRGAGGCDTRFSVDWARPERNGCPPGDQATIQAFVLERTEDVATTLAGGPAPTCTGAPAATAGPGGDSHACESKQLAAAGAYFA